MRKIKVKKENKLLKPTTEEILVYFYCRITNLFAGMFENPSITILKCYSDGLVSDTLLVNENSKRIRAYSKACENRKKIVLFDYDGIDLFDCYGISELMKLFYKLDIQNLIEELDYREYQKKDFDVFIKLSRLEYQKSRMMFYEYFKNDSKLMLLVFNLFFELTTNVRLFDFMYEKFNIKQDKKTKTFITKYKKFVDRFLEDLTREEVLI